MRFVLQPRRHLLVILAGWFNRQQQQVIQYLRAENQVLEEKLGKKRVLLSDDQRRRFAVKGNVLRRSLLGEIGTLATPDTILGWHRVLVAHNWDCSHRRTKNPGRAPELESVRQLVLRLARENPRWGYDRIVPPESPNLHAHLERLHRCLKEECLEWMIFFGEESIHTGVSRFLVRYHRQRNHQGLGNAIPGPGAEVGRREGPVCCRKRLGGLRRYFYRAAA